MRMLNALPVVTLRTPARILRFPALVMVLSLVLAGCRSPVVYDTVLRGGVIYDGTGAKPWVGDVAINGDTIAAIGPSLPGRAQREIDARGLAVAPGLINMLSWANESLIEDGRSQGDIRQGVTLEVMGEGESMGPLTDTMKTILKSFQGDIKYPVTWTTLGGYLESLVAKGISPNVASFVGATTVREYVLGWEDRPPSAAELQRMQALVREAMEEGALGVSSALMYVPAFFARTDELVALAEAAAQYDGMYISHIRSESNQLLESAEEFLTIARATAIRAEIYHLKAAGKQNFPKLDSLIARINSARSEGLAITADIYPYIASATGLDAAMPPWVQEGGYAAWAKRLQDPGIRAKVKREMDTPTDAWDNAYLNPGSPDGILLVEFKTDSLKRYTGKTLAEVAALRGTSPEETAMDLVIQDGSRVGAIYFVMSEENIRKELAQEWVSIGSDAGSVAPEGVFLKSNPHPRAYGSFARVLGKYSREEHVLPLEEAIRRMTLLPATNLRIARRGKLSPGNYADVVAFDPATITDNATFDRPHQYATGMVHVFVNGVQVLVDGRHTGAMPGRVVRGPGWRPGR